MVEKKTKLPIWPKDLPPFAEFKKLPKENYVHADEFEGKEDISNLIHDIYVFEDEKYFLYFEYGESEKIKIFPQDHLEKYGLSLRNYENYFYKRPWSDEKSDVFSYVRILPGEAVSKWQQDLVNEGPMYCRVKIELLPWKRKQLDYMSIASIKNSESKNPFELKPNFCGFGVDLNKVFNWLKLKFKKRV